MRQLIAMAMLLSCSAALISHPATAEAKRSYKAKSAFKQAHPCPATGKSKGRCPGYIIDHINPLACGGADAPYNMQWQTVEEAKSKDRWERKGCQTTR